MGLGIALLTAALAIPNCSRKPGSDEDAGGGGKAEAPVAEVTVTRVTRADISQNIAVNGAAAALPNQDVRVSALVPGRVAEMTVAEGDRVQAGQVLAKLDDRTYRDQLQQAEAAVAQAKANAKNTRLARERNEKLLGRGIVARKDVEDARTQEKVAAEALKQAEAALDLTHLHVSRTRIASPISGRVAKRFLGVGEQVDGTAAQPILEVANLNQIELIGNVPATYLSKIKAGQSLSVTCEAALGKTFQGRVVAISPTVDPATNVGVVRIRIPNPDGLLRMGMYMSAQVPIEMHAKALGVPPEAVYRDDQGAPRVFRVEQDNATAVPVLLGITTTDRVELLSGVNEGDTVILTGGYGLHDKAKVKIKP